MAHGGGAFSPDEINYLKSLPAVSEATSTRITYSEAFKRLSLRRYMAGESPVKLFREAGMSPELIGYKRIERAFARWKKAEAGAVRGDPSDEGRRSWKGGADDGTSQARLSDREGLARAGQTIDMPLPGSEASRKFDIRDVLIFQQIRRIDELEAQVDRLRAQLDHMDACGSAAGDDAGDPSVND